MPISILSFERRTNDYSYIKGKLDFNIPNVLI